MTTPPPEFESREERENYYRWVYCVKNNITDMERFGVKPLGVIPSDAPVERKPSGKKPLEIEMAPGMVTALVMTSNAFSIFGTLCRYVWNFFAIVTAMAILGMLIGWLIA